ncbi:helix-turn-helix transcriptional regulator [Staphylococcus saccharolyticus]|uniref:helix-turn-helix transcriptional regulator n=1 Tax=Staphylococcus saccharolyticus TaxID=33028 RepID=UPI0032DE7BC5
MIDNYTIRVFNHLAIETTTALNVRVFYCLKGKCNITINIQEFELRKDEIAFVIVNDTYSLVSTKNSTCCVIDIPIHYYFRYNQQHLLSNGMKVDKGRIKYWIFQLLKLHCLSKVDKLETNKLIQYLLIELGNLKLQPVKFNRHMYFSEEVHQYLVDHHESKINKQDLANAVNMSNQSLTQMFKQTPFQTFNQYLNQIRLKFCLTDILTTHRPIEDIAIDHGFHHYYRFIQLFKDTYGRAPKLIRKDCITTSMFKKSSEEINLDRHILKFINDLQDTASGVIDVKQLAISEEELKY